MHFNNFEGRERNMDMFNFQQKNYRPIAENHHTAVRNVDDNAPHNLKKKSD